MYRCEVCCNVSRPGQHLLRYTIYRNVPSRDVRFRVKDAYGNIRSGVRTEPARTEIAKEVALCTTCYEQVRSGVPISTVVSTRGVELRPYPNSFPERKIVRVETREYTDDEVDSILDSEEPIRIPITKTVVEEQPPKVRKGNSLYGSPRPTNRKSS